MVVTWRFDKEQAGTVFTTTTLFLLTMTIVQFGADVGLVRWLPSHVATGAEHNVTATLRAAFVPVLGLSIVVAVAAIGTAPMVAGLFDSEYPDDISKQLMVLAVFLPIAAIYSLALASTRAFRTMRPTVLVDSVGRDLTQLGLVLLAGAVGLGSVGFVLMWAIPYPFALVVAGTWLIVLIRRSREAARAKGRGDGAADPDVASQFWRYTAPRGLATIAQTLLKRSDILLVGLLANDFGQVALYVAATRFVVFGQLAVQALQLALAPQMSAVLARGEHDAAQDVYRTTTAWGMVLAWPVYIISAVLAPWILMVLFRPSYAEAAPVVVILVAGHAGGHRVWVGRHRASHGRSQLVEPAQHRDRVGGERRPEPPSDPQDRNHWCSDLLGDRHPHSQRASTHHDQPDAGDVTVRARIGLGGAQCGLVSWCRARRLCVWPARHSERCSVQSSSVGSPTLRHCGGVARRSS